MTVVSQARGAGRHSNVARKSQRRQSGHRILVVDDDEAILHSVRALLSREGHDVLVAQGGAEALEIFRQEEIHLLLVDYFMPHMSGEELIGEIRRFDPLVQIVLQTGYSGEKPPRDMLRELDIQGYHDKGRGPRELLLWVDVALKSHERLNQLRERERLQAELVANVSHEFRTPLNIIGGYTELLAIGEFGRVDGQASEILTRVQKACRDLGDLVGDFLRYARVQADVEEVGQGEIVVDDLVDEMERYGRLILGDGKPIQLEVDCARAPRVFVSDAVKVRTILRNLLTNAVKFTEEGSIRIRFEAAPDGSTSIAVADSGIGIAPDAQEAIFEPFRQLDGSSTRTHGGVGLGLALSKKLAYLLGGDLTVESQPGRGSTFTLCLPPRCIEERKTKLAGDAQASA